MGCTQSKIDNEEAVTRCKDRKQIMKEAVAFRNAFAAAHSAYAMSLKNTGAALSDYVHAELPLLAAPNLPPPPPSSSVPRPPPPSSSVPPPSGLDSLPPPPPPLESFQPLQRAASMPEMKIEKKAEAGKAVGPTIEEEDEIEFEAQDNEKLVRKRSGSSKRGSAQENHHDHDRDLRDGHVSNQQQLLMRGRPAAQEDAWTEYIFSTESMPAPTLAEPELPQQKAFEEKLRRVEEEAIPAAVEESPQEAEKKLMKKAAVGGGEGGRRMGKALNLMQIFGELDDHFLKASESAHEVSKLLEATRLHYHSNFADNRGHIDHSARVMRVITWNRSFRGIPNVDDGKDDFDSEAHETHATVLDKILAWEKKLYDEVRAGELMKYEYQRKVNSLNKRKKQGSNPESLEKLKAAVSHLHTRYIVDMQSLDSTVLEINRLRDEQLYPKLVQLVDGMATMWETMRAHHEEQSKLVNMIRSWDVPHSSKETSEHHHDRTYQLWAVVQEWYAQFCKLIDNQRLYVKALNNWLKLNLIPIESNLREKVSSPPRVANPPIQRLLIAWQDYLNVLSDDGARTAINNFAAVVDTIMQYQLEEIKMKEKCEETRKELGRKNRQFEDWYRKHMERVIPAEGELERENSNAHDDALAERQFHLDTLKKRLEEEEAAYMRQCVQVRDKSLATLKIRLPELFRALCDISGACSEMYWSLKNTAEQQKRR